MPDDNIRTVGTIIKVLSSSHCHAQLLNGKCIIAHLSKELIETEWSLTAGAQVLLEMTPYDLEKARILAAIE